MKDRFKSKAEETAERAREAGRTFRASKVRQIIDEYADNNQMPLHKSNSRVTINGSFDQKKGAIQPIDDFLEESKTDSMIEDTIITAKDIHL